MGYLLLKNPWNLTVDQTKEGRYTLNRSPDAHRENRPKPPDAIDPYLTVLRVDRVDGNTIRPLAVYSVFAIHGTAVPLENTLWNGDVQAAMARYLEWKVKAGKDSGFMHLTANGNEGDIRPYYSQTIRRKNHSLAQLNRHWGCSPAAVEGCPACGAVSAKPSPATVAA